MLAGYYLALSRARRCRAPLPALFAYFVPRPVRFCRVLLLGRIVTGVGVGCGFVVAPVYIAEITPPHVRGRLTALTGESGRVEYPGTGRGGGIPCFVWWHVKYLFFLPRPFLSR